MIHNAVLWMKANGWIEERDEETELRATHTYEQHGNHQYQFSFLDIGEGWGSVGRALTEGWPESRVIGLDIRGLTYTGLKHGRITAAVEHDLAQSLLSEEEWQAYLQNPCSLLEKKIGMKLKQLKLLWASLECTHFSVANQINQPAGCAHGYKALTEMNQRAASEERLELEALLLSLDLRSVQYVIRILEAVPDLKFAIENPLDSDLWKLDMVKGAIERNGWRKVPIDQCAYGRRAQKPTYIMTNIAHWTPKGITGNGRCKIAVCAGTRGNVAGDRRHKEQTVASHKSRRVGQGEKVGGRREFTRDAVINAVEAGLIQEIAAAAMGL